MMTIPDPRKRRIIHPAIRALHELLEFDGTIIPLRLLRKHVSPRWAMRALEDWDQFCCVSLFTIHWKKEAEAARAAAAAGVSQGSEHPAMKGGDR